MDTVTKVGLRLLSVHKALYQRSGGRIGHRLLGDPTLLMTTTGKRTGKRRTSALTYARDGDDYVVVASVGGADEAPAWLANIKADPNVDVQIGRRRFGAVARVVERDDPDHARLWRIANDNNFDRYDRYQRKTARPIPVVVLTPRPPGT